MGGHGGRAQWSCGKSRISFDAGSGSAASGSGVITSVCTTIEGERRLNSTDASQTANMVMTSAIGVFQLAAIRSMVHLLLCPEQEACHVFTRRRPAKFAIRNGRLL